MMTYRALAFALAPLFLLLSLFVSIHCVSPRYIFVLLAKAKTLESEHRVGEEKSQ